MASTDTGAQQRTADMANSPVAPEVADVPDQDPTLITLDTELGGAKLVGGAEAVAGPEPAATPSGVLDTDSAPAGSGADVECTFGDDRRPRWGRRDRTLGRFGRGSHLWPGGH
ncbi:hypothetical protein [Mycolicibacterium neoaurum]|uniref:hypothetical protein n=1 Tax=Mycolicibacterium neoaurum TaxID=1795 RepID=UPI001F4D1FDD|nr:hypothetical protein [Mycolicibacterium neoaurum]